ncbi:MAG: beta-lactamase family protein [Clostridiales bacterium]|jgi:CubicO group peptidase (beta-lactamase class C family)|nr:beta-lactamase family protein [Clostridiales bacterium]
MNFSKLTAYLDSFYAEKNIPGVGCAVYYRHKPVYEHYAGYSNVEKGVAFGPRTIFHLYSATKISTCTAILQLCESGKLGLDDPVSRYIPEYADLTALCDLPDGRQEIRPAVTPLTVRHLLSMQGGVGGLDTDAVERAIQDTGGKGPTLTLIRALAGRPLFFEPGSHFRYSSCHDVLGGLVEVVSGKRFGAYLKEHVFDPLGMGDTAFSVKPEDEPRTALIYNGFDAKTGRAASVGETYRLNPGTEYESGGGGLFSTVSDYILLTEALCNFGLGASGARILKKETVELMRTNQLGEVSQKDFTEFGGTSKTGYGYGLGVRVLVNREKNNALSANGEFGWDGARGCYAVIDPDSELALFYAQQEGGSQWWFWHGTVRNYAYASLWQD